MLDGVCLDQEKLVQARGRSHKNPVNTVKLSTGKVSRESREADAEA